MGKWSSSLNGSDFIHDLLLEYKVAFFTYPPEEAVLRLDEYVRNNLKVTNEEWTNYILSIAIFVHKNGIQLSKTVERALEEIGVICSKNQFGADDIVSYKELMKVQKLLLEPFPPGKRIHLDMNLHPVFQIGDVIALQIHSNESLQFADKYIAMKKIGNIVSWKSALNPNITDNWPIFQLTDCYMDSLPTINDYLRSRKTSIIFSDGKIAPYKKRKYVLLGFEKVNQPLQKCGDYFFFSANHDEGIKSLCKAIPNR
jgi:hypothetical protein